MGYMLILFTTLLSGKVENIAIDANIYISEERCIKVAKSIKSINSRIQTACVNRLPK